MAPRLLSGSADARDKSARDLFYNKTDAGQAFEHFSKPIAKRQDAAQRASLRQAEFRPVRDAARGCLPIAKPFHVQHSFRLRHLSWPYLRTVHCFPVVTPSSIV